MYEIRIALCSSSISPVLLAGSKTGKIVAVDITPACGDERYCILQSGKNVNLAWTIKATENLKAMTAKVYGTIAGVPVPFPLPNPNACKSSNVTCPVKDGDTFTYDLDLEVKSVYPKASKTTNPLL
jgi:Niemann-Pick C2 protein